MQWFRVYNEILDDPKVAKMDGETFRCFIYLLAISSEQETNGIIDMSISDISWRIRIPLNILETAIAYFLENDILSKEDDSFVITNWKKRQFASDNVGQRVKRFREKQCNVTSNTLSNVSSNVIDTDTDTDTDTEKKKNIPLPKKPKIPKTKYLDSVFLTDQEYKKLQEAMGQKNLDVGIEQLDYSISVKGGKYKDHYKTILNWNKRGFLKQNGGDTNATGNGSFRKQIRTERDAINAAADDEADIINRERAERIAREAARISANGQPTTDA